MFFDTWFFHSHIVFWFFIIYIIQKYDWNNKKNFESKKNFWINNDNCSQFCDNIEIKKNQIRKCDCYNDLVERTCLYFASRDFFLVIPDFFFQDLSSENEFDSPKKIKRQWIYFIFRRTELIFTDKKKITHTKISSKWSHS